MNHPPIVILGSGMAGYALAREFRKLDTDTRVIMVSADDGAMYSKPMLSNALAQGKAPDALVMKGAARAAAGKIDFATSNLRGAPFTLYVSGARVLRIVTMGPVAGTACNATALSYENSFDIGLFIDPVAIDEPGDFRDRVAAAFADILEL